MLLVESGGESHQLGKEGGAEIGFDFTRGTVPSMPHPEAEDAAQDGEDRDPPGGRADRGGGGRPGEHQGVDALLQVARAEGREEIGGEQAEEADAIGRLVTAEIGQQEL